MDLGRLTGPLDDLLRLAAGLAEPLAVLTE